MFLCYLFLTVFFRVSDLTRDYAGTCPRGLAWRKKKEKKTQYHRKNVWFVYMIPFLDVFLVKKRYYRNKGLGLAWDCVKVLYINPFYTTALIYAYTMPERLSSQSDQKWKFQKRNSKISISQLFSEFRQMWKYTLS